MSHPVPTQDYKMPEDNITMSEAIFEVFVKDDYDDRVDQFNPFYQDYV